MIYENDIYWALACTLIPLVIEVIYVMIKRHGAEWKLWYVSITIILLHRSRSHLMYVRCLFAYIFTMQFFNPNLLKFSVTGPVIQK